MDQVFRKMPAVQHGRGLSCASSSTLNLMILILPQNKRYSYFPGHIILRKAIGHFRVPKNLTFKTRLSAKPLL